MMSDADQAKKWASEYIADLKPRLSDLYSTNYEMNFLKVLLGLPIENHSFKIEGLQAISLLVFAEKDPNPNLESLWITEVIIVQQ